MSKYDDNRVYKEDNVRSAEGTITAVPKDSTWSYHEEVHQGVPVESAEFEHLACVEGIAGAADSALCYKGSVVLKKPLLRRGNLANILDYLPPSYYTVTRTRYVLGIEKCVFDSVLQETRFDLYLWDARCPALAGSEHRAHFVLPPGTHRQLVMDRAFVLLEVVERPKWTTKC